MTHQLVTHPIFLPISTCYDNPSACCGSNSCSSLCPNSCSNSCDNPSSCSGSNVCPAFNCSNFCDNPSARSESNFKTKFCCSNFCPKFHDNPSSCSGSYFQLCDHSSSRSGANFHFLPFQSSHRFLSPSFCSLCCSPSLTDNSNIVKPPFIETLRPCVGLDCSEDSCVDGNRLAACSHAGSVHKSVLQSLDQQSASVQLSA